MKLRRTEQAIIAVSAALLLLMAGRAWGQMSVRTLSFSPAGDPLPAASEPEETALRALPSAGEPDTAPSPEQDAAPSPEAPEEAPSSQGLVDINTAGREELMTLPGIGEKRAQAILDWREEHGPFRYTEDLIRIPGIGEKLLAGLEGYITVGG